MFPGAPLVIRGVEPQCPLKLGNKMFKNGDRLAFCPFALHNDPSYWENPTKYNMKRFDSSDNIQLDAFMPFGVLPENGGRACVGRKYAMFIMDKIVRTLFANFTFHLDTTKDYKVVGYVGSLKPQNKIFGTIVCD